MSDVGKCYEKDENGKFLRNIKKGENIFNEHKTDGYARSRKSHIGIYCLL